MIQTDSVPIEFCYQVSPDDRETVRQIVRATGFFSAAEEDIALELVEERLRRADESGYHFVFARNHGATLGYACYGPIACTVGSFDLYWIAVRPGAQARGTGRRIVAEVERLVRTMGGRQIYIETSNRAQYAPTRAFYQRCGYETVALLPDFYAPGDDKVVFRKAV